MTHLAAIFTYSLVIYGTFLTRSGILGDFSVHSFSNSNIGLTIAIVNALVLIGGLIILIQKVQYLPKGKMYDSFNERAFLILLGALVLVFVASIVWIGMSMPLLTAALDNPAAVDTAFYTSHSVCQPPVARLTALGTMRGLRLFRVTVSPFGYIPNENKLLYHSKVEVRITFAGADEQATAHEIQRNGGLPSVPIANKAVFENLLLRNTIATPKYVVVTQDSFAAALRPFLWWKRQSGFNVVELYTHSGDTCTYIRSRLDSLYSAATPLDPAPSFLLIVGDV